MARRFGVARVCHITKEAHQTGYEVEKMPRDQVLPDGQIGLCPAQTANTDNSFRTGKESQTRKTELKEVKN